LIYGVTGSGKTTLAARISTITGIPWHAVDELTWEPGWVQVPDDEQQRRIEVICAGECWILDTAYARWLDIPLARTELIVALDFPRWFSVQVDPPHCDAGYRSQADLQRQPRVVQAHGLRRLHHRVALQAVSPDALAHQGLGDRLQHAGDDSFHFTSAA
jgi:hypothetical protein